MKAFAVMALAGSLTGCAGMFHKPDVTATIAELKAGDVCGINVLPVSMFDPVILKACASSTVAGARLTVLFGTMHEETSRASNWAVQVKSPKGEAIFTSDSLEGVTKIGACGTGGCSQETTVNLALPQPWAKGTYTVTCTSNAQPVLTAAFHLTFKERRRAAAGDEGAAPLVVRSLAALRAAAPPVEVRRSPHSAVGPSA